MMFVHNFRHSSEISSSLSLSSNSIANNFATSPYFLIRTQSLMYFILGSWINYFFLRNLEYSMLHLALYASRFQNTMTISWMHGKAVPLIFCGMHLWQQGRTSGNWQIQSIKKIQTISGRYNLAVQIQKNNSSEM
jgi:hypothetical protein